MPPGFDPASVVAAVGVLVFAVSPYVKIAIDLLRMAVPLPKWAPPALAFSCGVAFCPLLLIAAKVPLTPDLYALFPLAGLAVAANAVGMTETQNKANDAVRDRRRESARGD